MEAGPGAEGPVKIIDGLVEGSTSKSARKRIFKVSPYTVPISPRSSTPYSLTDSPAWSGLVWSGGVGVGRWGGSGCGGLIGRVVWTVGWFLPAVPYPWSCGRSWSTKIVGCGHTGTDSRCGLVWCDLVWCVVGGVVGRGVKH